MKSTIRLSHRLTQLAPSPTLAIAAKAAEMKNSGQPVINLSAGEPDFDTPEPIRKAALLAMESGQTRYTPSDGIRSLRAAIQDKFETQNSLHFPLDSILVAPGAKYALHALTQCLLNPGDRVVIVAPYWVSYPDIIRLSGAECMVLETQARGCYRLDLDALDRALAAPSRLFILNSPSNPTGVQYRRAELASIGAVLRRHPQIVIATDDLYESILWSDEPFSNLPMVCPDLQDRCVVINGVSKTYAMTGWRIGYAAGPKSLIRAMSDFQSHTVASANSIAQAAAEAALRSDPGLITDMVNAYHKRHDYLAPEIGRLAGVEVTPADGTFYLFADCRSFLNGTPSIGDDVALATALLEHAGVAVVPGSAFGAPGHLRLSYATDLAALHTAVERLRHFWSSHTGTHR
ncbi:Aspartate/tyrosine/aromatic aminotransferase [mine drainage metagenome]|uniref:Aspartate/tyrosine/aromatic aminotransferase n=1 Tax=mine drainage metagenome TaxID=410659 RepID=T1C6L0_9ZZZZ